MKSEATKLFLIKADCSGIMFRAEAIEHILLFPQKKEKKIKQKKIKRMRDASKAAPLTALAIKNNLHLQTEGNKNLQICQILLCSRLSKAAL